MKTYTIYHIPGVKIGVSTRLINRLEEQGFSNYEILEEHVDIYEVSNREQELQKEYGYKVDSKPYWKVVEDGLRGLANVKPENRIVNNKEHQSKASAAAHKSKLKKGFYNYLGELKRKLTYKDAQKIRKLYTNGNKQRDIANQYNVSQRTIANIIHYRTYNNVENIHGFQPNTSTTKSN